MFEQLELELATIKTPKFHVVEGTGSDSLKRVVRKYGSRFPKSYKEFVVRYGNAKLYRQGSVYLVQVFAAPREVETADETKLLYFGRTDTAQAFFKPSLLARRRDAPIFEWRYHQGIREVAISFEAWFDKKCQTAKRRFKRAAWKAIERGPLPFNEREEIIVEARKMIRWRLTGVSENGDLAFEIHNGSNTVLPYLSLGVRQKKGEFEGGIWLPISSVGPNETSGT